MWRRVFAASLAFVAGCTTVKLQAVFDPEQAAYIHQQGKGSIEGQAFLRRNDGMVVYAAGSEVSLMPVTPYTTERMNAVFQGRRFASVMSSKKFENEDPRFATFVRKTVADGEGRFSFSGLAAGRYYVGTTVMWTPDPNAIIPEGGALHAEVTVPDAAEPQRVIMSGN